MINIVKPDNKLIFKTDGKEVYVVTHDGFFHSDEIFAIALLKLFYNEMNIVRTRDSKLLLLATLNPEVFVLDVGKVYEPENKNFDHHQKNAPEHLSTVSMLFSYLFPHYLADKKLKIVSRRLISCISEWDLGKTNTQQSGEHSYVLPQLISAFNRFGVAEQDSQFLKAIDFASLIIVNELNTAEEIIRSKRIWQNREELNHKIVLLHEHCTFWRSFGNKHNNYKYIVQPSSGNWSVFTVDSKQYPLPVVDDDYPGLIFQHDNNFISVFNNSKSALQYVTQHLIP